MFTIHTSYFHTAMTYSARVDIRTVLCLFTTLNFFNCFYFSY